MYTFVFVGEVCFVSLADGDIDNYQIDKCFDSVRQFYETAFDYCRKWLPLNNTLVKRCRFINFKDRLKYTFDDVQAIIELFPSFFHDYLEDPLKLDSLEEEFIQYQSLCDNEIPQYIWDRSNVYEKEKVVYHRMDTIWAYLREAMPKLSKIALLILTIPHSNAAEGPCFPLIKKNKTDYRASLQLSGSLDSIMVIKTHSPEEVVPCYKTKFSKEVLRKIKSACTKYNDAHSSAIN